MNVAAKHARPALRALDLTKPFHTSELPSWQIPIYLAMYRAVEGQVVAIVACHTGIGRAAMEAAVRDEVIATSDLTMAAEPLSPQSDALYRRLLAMALDQFFIRLTIRERKARTNAEEAA